jgi:hypothetical protein
MHQYTSFGSLKDDAFSSFREALEFSSLQVEARWLNMIEESNKNFFFKSLDFSQVSIHWTRYHYSISGNHMNKMWSQFGFVFMKAMWSDKSFSSYQATSATLITFGVTSFFFLEGNYWDSIVIMFLLKIWRRFSGILRYFLSGDNYVFINVILQCTCHPACPTN